MMDGAEEVTCLHDPEALLCICDPPCGAICAFSECPNPAAIMVPGELVFGFENGAIINPVWDSPMDSLLSQGGWDTWVCTEHGY